MTFDESMRRPELPPGWEDRLAADMDDAVAKWLALERELDAED